MLLANIRFTIYYQNMLCKRNSKRKDEKPKKETVTD